MNEALVITLIALTASSNVTEGIKKRTVSGGERAEYALSKCMEAPMPIEKGFHLSFADDDGRYELNCQTLETTTGLFYAVKGEYRRDVLKLEDLIEAFNKSPVDR